MKVTKSYLNEVLDGIIRNYNFNKENYEWITLDYDSNLLLSKKELYFQLTKILSNWYYYLKFYVEEEEFELCAKLKDVIEIEKKSFKEMIDKNYPDYIEKNEQDYIDYVDVEIKNTINL